MKQSKINHWIVIGAETDVCVYQTTKELLRQNNQVTLVKEAVYSGRNNTEISRNNLLSFGAHFISLKELYSNKHLFIESQPKVEAPLDFTNTVLTIFPTSDHTTNGDSKRLDYLIQYANVIGLKTESPDEVSGKYKTRLIAGSITQEKYKELKKKTKEGLIVIADCTPQLLSSDIPKVWHVHTLKIVFYEFMETAAFYSKSVEELEGWQKKLKKAMKDGSLDYVETLQNE